MAGEVTGLVLLAVIIVLLLAAVVRSGQLSRRERDAVGPKDSAPPRGRPDSDTSGDADSPKKPLAVRMDELEYRFAALKLAHDNLSESIGTRFATMGKRISRTRGEDDAAIAGDGEPQLELVAANGGSPAPRPSASASPARRLVPRPSSRR